MTISKKRQLINCLLVDGVVIIRLHNSLNMFSLFLLLFGVELAWNETKTKSVVAERDGITFLSIGELFFFLALPPLISMAKKESSG